MRISIISIFKGDWSGAWDAVKGIFTAVWDYIKSSMQNALNTLKGVANAFLGWFGTSWDQIWNGVKTATVNAWNGIKSAASTAVNAVKSAVTSAWNAIKSATTSTWNAIKSAISTPINAALSTVKSVIDKIKSAFNFSWSLPHLKLPHLSITGSFSINPPSVPHFSISWYKNGGIMTDPTLFGMAGTTALAGGEAGPEAILPLRPFYDYLNAVLDEKLNRFLEAAESVLYVYCYIDGDQVAAKTVKRVSKAMAGEALRAR